MKLGCLSIIELCLKFKVESCFWNRNHKKKIEKKKRKGRKPHFGSKSPPATHFFPCSCLAQLGKPDSHWRSYSLTHGTHCSVSFATWCACLADRQVGPPPQILPQPSSVTISTAKPHPNPQQIARGTSPTNRPQTVALLPWGRRSRASSSPGESGGWVHLPRGWRDNLNNLREIRALFNPPQTDLW